MQNEALKNSIFHPVGCRVPRHSKEAASEVFMPCYIMNC